MPLSCFSARGGGGGGDPSAAAPPSSSSTSVYWTHLGGVTLTWSRAPIGLLLTADLHLHGDDGDAPVRFALRPWLPWRRRGSKRFSTPGGGRAVTFSWDLSRARFAATGRRPEPVSRYSLHVSVDGELALAVGDHHHHHAPSSSAPGLLLSRRENAVAVAADEAAFSTTVTVAGERHEVSLAVEGGSAAMWVAVDGQKALQVRRLRWKFRGSERLDLPTVAGCRVRVTWDLHGWLFCPDPDAAAVFVLRFETSDEDDDDEKDDDDDDHGGIQRQSSFSFRNHHHHQAHGGGGGGGGGGESWYSSSESERRPGWTRRGSDTSPSVSVASTSAASSSAGSVATVAEWEEEAAALKDGGAGGGGFSLVVQLWKKRRS